MVDTETLIVPASKYNLENDKLCAIARRTTPVALAEAFAGAFQLASQCWDAQKFYANCANFGNPHPKTQERNYERNKR